MRRPPIDLADRLYAVSDRVLAPDRIPGVDAVATITGIPRATLYYYFAGRDALVDFLLLDKVDRIGTRIAQVLEAEADSATRLTAVLTTAVDTIAAHPALCTTLTARLAVRADDHELGTAVDRSVLRPLRRLLAEGHADGELDVDDPDLTAHALYGAISMATLARFARDGTIDAEQLAGTLVPQLVTSVRRFGARDDRSRAPR